MSVAAQFPEEQSDDGEFQRQEDAFRDWITPEGPYTPEAGRYHLYVSYACPWAHRTIIVRRLKRLSGIIGMSVVDPIRTEEEGWAFREGPGQSLDEVNGFRLLREAYTATDPAFRGRVTVLVLWDKQTSRIVNNSEDDIMRMFNSAFDGSGADPSIDLYPLPLRAEIDRLNALIYETVNNGVYRAGFATTQRAYERGVLALFDTLDLLETRLGRTRYLLGSTIVETDWRLFVTLLRFDAVYHGHFKCNLRRIVDYPNLSGYLRDLYQQPGIAGTVHMDHIKRHYYVTHDDINPTQIVPIGPDQDFTAPPDRDWLH